LLIRQDRANRIRPVTTREHRSERVGPIALVLAAKSGLSGKVGCLTRPWLGNLADVTQRFVEAMRLMRKADPQSREDGFHMLLPHASDHAEQLIAEFLAARDDHGLRCWLLELIGAARSPLALPVLVDQLNGQDEALRRWAVHGLRLLGSRQAREALWRARCNGEPV
jgi:hypothetical protein